jgi:hypothetical protein
VAPLSQVFLDGPLADADVELQQLATDALGTPQRIVAPHRLDEGDGRGSERRRLGAGGRFASPEQSEALPVPAQHRRGLDDQERARPGAQPAGEQDQQPTIPGRERRPFGPPAEDDDLRPQEGALQQELLAGADEIRRQACGE